MAKKFVVIQDNGSIYLQCVKCESKNNTPNTIRSDDLLLSEALKLAAGLDADMVYGRRLPTYDCKHV